MRRSADLWDRPGGVPGPTPWASSRSCRCPNPSTPSKRSTSSTWSGATTTADDPVWPCLRWTTPVPRRASRSSDRRGNRDLGDGSRQPGSGQRYRGHRHDVMNARPLPAARAAGVGLGAAGAGSGHVGTGLQAVRAKTGMSSAPDSSCRWSSPITKPMSPAGRAAVSVAWCPTACRRCWAPWA